MLSSNTSQGTGLRKPAGLFRSQAASTAFSSWVRGPFVTVQACQTASKETKCQQPPVWSTPAPPPRFSIISCSLKNVETDHFSKKPRMVEYAPRRLAEGLMGSWGLIRSLLKPKEFPLEDWTSHCSLYTPRTPCRESFPGCFAPKLVKFIRKDFTHSKRGRSRNNTV